MSEAAKMRNETKDRLVDVAEGLFAERGFVETSLRVITRRAEVNLAAVNYHFGSKTHLIQAVFDRYLAEFFRNVSANMAELEALTDVASVDAVLETMVEPLIALDQMRPDGTSIFMRLLGRAYAESQGHMRRFLSEHYSAVMQRFYHLIYQALPGHSPSEVFWRLHFSMGAVIFTLAGSQALADISAADFGQRVGVQQIAVQLVTYLASGLKAPSSPIRLFPSGSITPTAEVF